MKAEEKAKAKIVKWCLRQDCALLATDGDGSGAELSAGRKAGKGQVYILAESRQEAASELAAVRTLEFCWLTV